MTARVAGDLMGTVIDGEILAWAGGALTWLSPHSSAASAAVAQCELLARRACATDGVRTSWIIEAPMRARVLDRPGAATHWRRACGIPSTRCRGCLELPRTGAPRRRYSAAREARRRGVDAQRCDSDWTGRPRGVAGGAGSRSLSCRRGHGHAQSGARTPRPAAHRLHARGVGWGRVLVPFAKAYSGPTDAELGDSSTAWISP